MKSRVKGALLWAAWLICFAVALAATGLFAHGAVRDTRIGEPAINVDPAAASGWQSAGFRVFGQGDYRLFISSVNHDPGRAGTPLEGTFEVAILDPEGNAVFEESFAGRETDHEIPGNYGDAELATLVLDDWPVRKWTLKFRVIDPDPGFKGIHTQVKLWKQRDDPGMGGLLNYVMIIPAGVFLLLALAASAALAARRRRWPLALTAVVGVGLMAALAVI